MERRKVARIVGTHIAAAAISVGAFEYYKQHVGLPSRIDGGETSRSLTLTPTPILGASREQIDSVIEKDGIYQAIDLYSMAHYSIQRDYRNVVSINGEKEGTFTPEQIKAFDLLSRNNLREGVELLQILHEKDQKQVDVKSNELQPSPPSLDPQTNSLNVDGISLQLNDTFQFQLATALVYYKVGLHRTLHSPVYFTGSQENQAIEELKWLALSSANITIEPDVVPLIEDDNMRALSRALKVLSDINVPFPKKIVYEKRNGEGYVGGYFDHTSSDPFKLMLNDDADLGTIFHESGHYLSDASFLPELGDRNFLERYSQEKFSAMLKALRIPVGYRYSTAFVQTEESEDRHFEEEYAEAFKAYFYNGTNFRNKIRTAIDPDVRKILLSEYKFMNSLARGDEFDYAIKVDFLPDEIDIRKYDRVKITYLDLNSRGVALSSKPDSGIDPNIPLIQEGESVTIVDGPEIVKDSEGNQVKMWKVKYTPGPTFNNYEGWVSSQFFSDLTPANSFTIPPPTPEIAITPTP